MDAFGAPSLYKNKSLSAPGAAATLFAGVGETPSVLFAFMIWVCEGISDSSKVTVFDPPDSPSVCIDKPVLCPDCIGALPFECGNAKFDWPFPPYKVPSKENSAV